MRVKPLIAGYMPTLGSARWWWLRSPNSNNTNNFRDVNSDGSNNNNNANNEGGVAFGVCVLADRVTYSLSTAKAVHTEGACNLSWLFSRDKQCLRCGRPDASCMGRSERNPAFMAFPWAIHTAPHKILYGGTYS